MNMALTGGFGDPAREAAVAFRAVMEAMARPGRLEQVAGAGAPGISVAAGVVLLTLCDATTPLHLAGAVDTKALRDWIGFHIGAPLVGAEGAVFALGDWAALQPLGRFAVGLPDYPDRSATLIVECERLVAEGPRLRGPGIRDDAHLSLPEVEAFQRNAGLFPLGLDFILTCGERLAAVPRTTLVGDN
jgi:alpha-D-ribose 1-methylphosphonate 5-triphosphate synthase subunit PhnH